MAHYKVTVRYWVQEDVIVEAESEEEAIRLAQESDEVETDNRDVLSEYEILEVDEL